MACRFTFLLLPALLVLGCGRVGFGPWGHDDDSDPIKPTWPSDDSPRDPDDDDENVDAGVVPTPQTPDDDAAVPPGGDGGVTPSGDGGMRPPTDGGPGTTPDGGGWPWPKPPTDGGTRPDGGGRPHGGGGGGCDGACFDDMCWYLSDRGESCEDACRRHGGTDRRAAKFVGTAAQGGSPEACARIMGALGASKTVKSGTRSDGLGLGCHRWSDGTIWWLSNTDFDDSAKAGPAELACACED